MAFNITIVGLGLIGGSIARRLKGFNNANITAYDIDTNILIKAKQDLHIDNFTTNEADCVENADLVIICLYPTDTVNFVKNNISHFKAGAVITDVSGVKGYVTDEINNVLINDMEFVGAHPMAGRETSGYISSSDTLFENASYIITPTETNSEKAVSLIEEIAKYIGCTKIVKTTPKEHDSIIAYTSQLMHVVALTLCNNPIIEKSAPFSAGSLRDCTRVGVLNDRMWSELFTLNKDELIKRIDEFEQTLQEVKNAVKEGDIDALKHLMQVSTIQKTKWLLK